MYVYVHVLHASVAVCTCNACILPRHAGGNGVEALTRDGEHGINIVRQRLLFDLNEEDAVKEAGSKRASLSIPVSLSLYLSLSLSLSSRASI